VHGAITPFHHMSSWCHRDILPYKFISVVRRDLNDLCLSFVTNLMVHNSVNTSEILALLGCYTAQMGSLFVCLFVCFPGRPRQAAGVLQPAGLLYGPLWTFQLWSPDAPAFRTLAAEVGTYGRE
jgi:hypothetical protein